MKNHKFTFLLVLLFSCGTIFFLSFKPILKHAKPETQIFYGQSVKTDEMHNAQIEGAYDPNVYGKYANSWFKHYVLTVSAPSGWHFTGQPYINCVQDNEGSCGWNNFPAAHDRFFVTQSNSNLITATCWAGSRSIIINLACEATRN